MNKSNRITLIIILLVCILAPISVSFYLLLNKEFLFGIIFLVLSIAVILSALIALNKTYFFFNRFYNHLSKQISSPNSEALSNLQLPVIVFENNKIKWYNSLFRTKLLKGNDIYDSSMEELFGDATAAAIAISDKTDYEINGRYFTIFKTTYSDKHEYTVLVFNDDTSLKISANEYQKTRPVVSLISLDTFDENSDDLLESQKAAIKSAVEKEIEQWASQTNGFTKKLNNKLTLFVLDERNFELLKKTKFDVLDRVRNLKFDGSIPQLTLSIGVGRGLPTLKECENTALKALEMAQGRGGDQTVVKSPDGYEFFGGISGSGKEVKNKVKARVIASALKELLKGSDTVFISGHKFSDLDSVGSSLALYKAARYFGIDAYIVMDKEKSLAQNLISQIERIYGDHVFITPEKALEKATRKSMAIIVDTHRASFMECPELLNVCPTYVVIDHHRRNVDHIENAVIFYHEPSTSSTCEMVTELLQYLGDKIIEKPEANALLSGITLDTRNFVLSTGVRTFEASAYLKSRGADTVEVKKLFAESVEVYKEKSKLINSAEIISCCAISQIAETSKYTRISASKAADELLGISDVKASFILYKAENGVNISARSFGGMNVQLIMETLGGGGHHTMAACQLQNLGMDEAKTKLVDSINNYIKNSNLS